MSDFLDVLARAAQITIDSEYYDAVKPADSMHISLRRALVECPSIAVITEIKSASPSAGVIRENVKPAEMPRQCKGAEPQPYPY
jgi:indole-3-glycerol phosphate synthase